MVAGVEVIGVAAGSEEAVAAEALGDLAAGPVEAAARPAVGKIRVICLLRGWVIARARMACWHEKKN